IDSVKIFDKLIQNTIVNKDRLKVVTENDLSLATELAEYLVQKNLPFRDAHRVTGKIVSFSIETATPLPKIAIEDYKKFSPLFEQDVYKVLTPLSSVKRKKSAGSTSPESVSAQLKYHKQKRKK
ncbi:MAG: argininosuccinate lyase, partial [Chlorobiales bacterium]|nr:argininosuccinate lyase [Chlorobiales bacterium]